ncbi:MAG: trypsin-like peptidase domain-containing protein [Clostridia bacterium]|nr:trypsin-like peptidase domain-containing protein [Clostridia bacterium]
MAILIAGSSGFLGAWLLLKNSSIPQEPSNSVLYQSVIRTVEEDEELGTALTVKEVAGISSPSVVEIVTEQVAYNSFFGQYTTSGAGSGVILSEDGLIVTNYHVVEGASTVKVILNTGKELQATVEGGDAENDLALLQVTLNGETLTPALLGKSSTLTVGEEVVAIGNPLGQLGGTVTNGIISALDREIEIDGVAMRLLQTNAAVNPGNSGGGLFNMYGELVGIVSAKSSASNTEGLGFAIPIDHAKTIIEELVSYGYVRGRIDLGMELVEILDAKTAMYYNVTESGVYIYSLEDTSLGFQPGDLILSIDGTEILTMEQFDQTIHFHKVGDTLTVSVKRRTGRNNYDTLTYSLPLKEEVPSFVN